MGFREASLSDILSSGQYHSAFISTYTIDPVFTKTIFIPLLQSNRIRNVTILSDRRELYRATQEKEILSLLKDSSFLLLPANTKRLFHPKVMLFVGEKTGLCVIGSGNLTHSGMGGNNEVWGAYHFSPKNQQNAGIFKDTWEFLQKYNPAISGIGKEKSRQWILNNSPWLNSIVSDKVETSSTPVNILSNDENSIWTSFLDKQKEKEPRQFIIVSPFYDKKAEMVRELKKNFPDVPINLIYDDFGTVPKLDKPIESVNCFNWNDITESTKELKKSSKLHAKAIIVIDENQNESILFGSPNFTRAGLGLKLPGNIELATYSESESISYQDELGISFKDVDSKPIHKILATSHNIDEPSAQSATRSQSILYAEQKSDQLIVDFYEVEKSQKVDLNLYDSKGDQIFDKPLWVDCQKELVISLKDFDPLPVVLFIETNEGQSRFLVYQASKHSVDNPDPKSATFRNALAEISKSSFDNLYDLFTDLFNSLTTDYRRNNDSERSQSNKSSDEESPGDDNEYYDRDELYEKKRGKGTSYSSSDFISDGLFAIIKMLDDELTSDEDETVQDEIKASDSSKELDTDEKESENPEKIVVEKLEEAERKKSGYQKYFKKAINYYSKAESILEEADSKTIQKFISNWLVVNSVALHTIKTDLNKPPFDGKNGLNKKTTILPFQKKGELSIDDISTKLIIRIVGRLKMSKYEISIDEYLDQEKRILGAVKMIELIHLKYWSEKNKFEKACKFIMAVFRVDQGSLLTEFKERFEYELSFYDKFVKENDWRYYRHFNQNLIKFKSVYL